MRWGREPIWWQALQAPLSSCAARVRSLPRQLHSVCWLALQSKFVKSASALYNPAVADKPVVAPRTPAAHPRQLLCLHGGAAAAPRPATHAVRRMLCFSTNSGSWLIRDPPLSEGQGTVPGSSCYCCCFSATWPAGVQRSRPSPACSHDSFQSCGCIPHLRATVTVSSQRPGAAAPSALSAELYQALQAAYTAAAVEGDLQSAWLRVQY